MGSCRKTYCYWCSDGDNIAFFDEELARFVAELADLRFWYWATCAQLCDCPLRRSAGAQGAVVMVCNILI